MKRGANSKELLRITPTNVGLLFIITGYSLLILTIMMEGINIFGRHCGFNRIPLRFTIVLAQALWQKGKAEEAEKLLRASLLLKPDNPDTHFYLAIVIGSRKERYLESLEQYREAIRIKPNHHRARLGLAITLQLHDKRRSG